MTGIFSSQRRDRRHRNPSNVSSSQPVEEKAVSQSSSTKKDEAGKTKAARPSPAELLKRLSRPEGSREKRRAERREERRHILEEQQTKEQGGQPSAAPSHLRAAHSAESSSASKRRAYVRSPRQAVEDPEPPTTTVSPARSQALRQRRVQAAPTLKPGLSSMAGPGARRAKLRAMGAQAPVVSRGGLAGLSSARSATSVPRRRYDIALNIPGAEIRLPAIPQVRFGWRLVSGALVAMMVFLLYLMLLTPAFEVEGVEMTGMQRLTSVDVNLALGLVGERIFAIDPADVQQGLETAFPELASQELSIGLPNKVALKVVERTPLLAWIQDGQELWIDAEGVSFPPRGEAEGLLRVESEGLPLGAEQVGPRQDLKLQPALVQTTLAMQPYLPEGAQLIYDHDRGFGWQDSRGWEVYFGQQITDINQKLATYQTLVDTLVGQGIQPVLISVEFLRAPYYRLER